MPDNICTDLRRYRFSHSFFLFFPAAPFASTVSPSPDVHVRVGIVWLADTADTI